MDWMHIRDICEKCIIGTKPIERKKKQAVVLQISMAVDLRKAGRSDRLEDTVNYQRIREEVVAHIRTSRHLLLEKMAEEVAKICLKNRLVGVVRVVLDKPGSFGGKGCAAIEIERRRK